MNKLSQKIELAANLLIILVAVLLVGVIVQKYFFSFTAGPVTNQKARLQPVVGSKLNIPDVNLTTHPKILVLVLQTGCRYCNESAPFYKRIVEIVKNKNIKLIAAFPSGVEESATHLKELGLNNMEVKQSPLNSLQVSGTPTLILINDKGEITDFWVGKLPPDKETEVINKLNS